MMRETRLANCWRCVAALMLLSALVGCGAGAGGSGLRLEGGESGAAVAIAELEPAELAADEKLRLVATTSLVADVVRAVAGETVEVTQLLPYGADPHGYLATPRDLQRVTESHLVIINGLGLEETLLEDLDAAAAGTARIAISEGITPRRFDGPAEDRDHEAEHDDGRHGFDPHVWMDPNLVMVWAENTAQALGALDPARRETYRENARVYRNRLASLDAWIESEISALPPAHRQLVTDHLVFGYFADRYRFEMVGAVIPAYSTQAEPSARELAQLQDLIDSRGARAVFVGVTANPTLAEQLAADLGVPLVPLYTGSLSEPGGLAPNYVEMMEYDVEAIVEALQ